MVTSIKKRDGRVEPFNKQKIVNAICRAMKCAEQDDMAAVERIADEIANSPQEMLEVEEIQDMVEMKLMKTSLKQTAKEFILYRDKRNHERERNSKLNRRIEEIVCGEKTQNSNANVDELSFSGRKFEAANALHKEIALNAFVRPEVAQAHRDARIYLHDLCDYDIGSHNCLFANVERLLKNGFSTRNGDVRPANSFSTACQLVAVIFQCQSQNQYGGVASAHIDYDLAPYVKKSFYKHFKEGMKYVENATVDDSFSDVMSIDDSRYKVYVEAYHYAADMMEKEGAQAAQGLWHNLNTLESRAGSQVPFSSLVFGMDTSPEGRLVTRWFLEASLAGIGKYNRTPIFPISIFVYKKGINDKPGTPNYDLRLLAEKSLSKRIYPNILNGDFSQNKYDESDPDTAPASMGCRTMLGFDRHGMGYKKTGRGNVCPTTMNLPRIGIRHGICFGERDKPDIDGFWEELKEVLALTETSLVDRFYHVCRQSVASAPFMYDNGTIADFEAAHARGIYEAMKHGTLAIGYIGIAEMCQALFGKDHSEDKDVHEFALSVVKFINTWAKEASERNDLNVTCYATPKLCGGLHSNV